MYEFKTRVRYSEVDSAGKLTITGIVNYLQDIATFHSNDVGFSIDKLKEIHRAWLLSSWDIYIHRLPKYCEEIKVCTSPHTFKGLLAARNAWSADGSGQTGKPSAAEQFSAPRLEEIINEKQSHNP